MTETALLLALAAIAWLWWDANRAREVARAAARSACQRAGVQFLDETVAHRRLRLARDEHGRLALVREFGFEFAVHGDRRHRGRVQLRAGRIEAVELEAFPV
jgi:hypothetical protein